LVVVALAGKYISISKGVDTPPLSGAVPYCTSVKEAKGCPGSPVSFFEQEKRMDIKNKAITS
jgi:hypothetical protein